MSLSLLPLIPSTKLQEILSKNKLKPIRRWENLNNPGVKEEVKKGVKNIGGIYAVINLVTGDMYIGSAVKGRMGNRFHKHLFGGTGSKIVYATVLKYGLSNFAFVVLESVMNENNEENNQIVLMREDHYLSTLKPIYNIAPNAGNTLGVKHTERTKTNMKIYYSSERREAIGALNRGKTLSASTIEAIRERALKRSPVSEETRNKISMIKGKSYLITRVDNTSFLSPEGVMVSSLTLRTLPVVRAFLDSNEKTVRRALKSDGIVKKDWYVKVRD